MKRSPLFFIFVIMILVNSCSEKTTVLSAIKDGEELSDGDKVSFLLNQNYPNPFNPTTQINFEVTKTTYLKLCVYTEDWIKVNTLFDKETYPGYYVVTFNCKDLPSGDYFYTLEGDGLVLTRKMKLLK